VEFDVGLLDRGSHLVGDAKVGPGVAHGKEVFVSATFGGQRGGSRLEDESYLVELDDRLIAEQHRHGRVCERVRRGGIKHSGAAARPDIDQAERAQLSIASRTVTELARPRWRGERSGSLSQRRRIRTPTSTPPSCRCRSY
jgi:hypothetical protein